MKIPVPSNPIQTRVTYIILFDGFSEQNKSYSWMIIIYYDTSSVINRLILYLYEGPYIHTYIYMNLVQLHNFLMIYTRYMLATQGLCMALGSPDLLLPHKTRALHA